MTIHSAFSFGLVLLMQFVTAGMSGAADDTSPEAKVRQITDDVLASIKSDKALALAEQKILPHVDFREAARLALGRTWSSATPEQQNRLVDEFRALLVRTYVNAIEIYAPRRCSKCSPGFARAGPKPFASSPARCWAGATSSRA